MIRMHLSLSAARSPRRFRPLALASWLAVGSAMAACTALAVSSALAGLEPACDSVLASFHVTPPASCCGTTSAESTASTASASARPTPPELADRVATALKQAPGLRFVETVRHGNATLEVRCWMQAAAFRTEVFQNGKAVYAISVVNDEVSEFLARGGPGADGIAVRDTEFRYPTSLPGRVENANACSRDFGCMFGGNLCSWVSPDSDTTQRLQRGISRCDKTEHATLEGRPCYLAQYQVTIPAGDDGKSHTIGHSYYVDPATSMLRRWVSFQQVEGGPKIERTRDYRDISTDRIPDTFAWVVSKDQFAAAPTVATAAPGR